MLVGDFHKHFQTQALAHRLFQAHTFGLTHEHSHIPTPTLSFCVFNCAFPSEGGERERERDGGIDRRDDWPCCFPLVGGKSDSMGGEIGGGEVERFFMHQTVPLSPLTL